jgi:hypothetical protein
MSILDDAIREHLELKRAHGADDSELKKLEDEAFGPPQRPDEIDPFAEAPTEFLAAPGETAADAPAIADEATRSGRRPDIADLQEPPPGAPGPSPADPARMPPPAPSDEAVAPEDELSPTPDAPPPSPAAAADVPLPPPPGEAPAADLAPPTGETPAPPDDESTGSFFDQFSAPATDAPPAPTEEAPPAPTDTSETAAPPSVEAVAPATDEVPAAPADEAPASPTDEAAPAGGAPAPLTDAGAPTDEAPAAAEPEPEADPDAEDDQAIVEQPTQMFDVQAHVDAEAAADAPPTGEQASPTDEQLVDAAAQEPQAAPPAPEENVAPPPLPEQPQLNLRGPDAEVAGHPPAEAEVEEGSAEFDFFNEQRLSDELDQALEAPLPPTEEHLAMPQYKDAPPEQAGIFDFQSDTPSPPQEERPYEDDPSAEVLRRADEAEAAEEPVEDDEPDPAFDPETGHEDVLEDTPRVLEDAPEDDDLWFEQKPPKDFDLD